MEVALSEPVGEKPIPKPLAFRESTTTARELPNGRGFLRVVSSSGGSPAPIAPAPTPAAPAMPAPVPPPPREPVQLSLFPAHDPSHA
jgi:hypothetical protein